MDANAVIRPSERQYQEYRNAHLSIERAGPEWMTFPAPTVYFTRPNQRTSVAGSPASTTTSPSIPGAMRPLLGASPNRSAGAVVRSEEHTSELQSLRHLVC